MSGGGVVVVMMLGGGEVRGTWAGSNGNCEQRRQKRRSRHALACLDASNPSIAAVPDGAAMAVALVVSAALDGVGRQSNGGRSHRAL